MEAELEALKAQVKLLRTDLMAALMDADIAREALRESAQREYNAKLAELDAELKPAIAKWDPLDEEATIAAKAAREALEEGVQGALDAAQHEYNTKLAELNKKFGIVNGRYPKGVEIGHPIAEDYNAQFDKLKLEFENEKSGIQMKPYRVEREVYNNFPGLQEAWDHVKAIRDKVCKMYWAKRSILESEIGDLTNIFRKNFLETVPELFDQIYDEEHY